VEVARDVYERRRKEEEKREKYPKDASIGLCKKNPFCQLPLNWYQLLLDFVAMGKTSRKKQKNNGDVVLDESSSTAHDDSASASLDNNTSGSVPNTTTDDGGERQEKAPESKVWKFATKVGSERARCNICQVGKIAVVTLHLSKASISCRWQRG
jgi:hypothetical protein